MTEPLERADEPRPSAGGIPGVGLALMDDVVMRWDVSVSSGRLAVQIASLRALTWLRCGCAEDAGMRPDAGRLRV